MMTVLPNQQLGHLYFGPSLGDLTAKELAYLADEPRQRLGSVQFDDQETLSLEFQGQELPVAGGSDFRPPLLTLEHEGQPLYLNLTVQTVQLVNGKARGEYPQTYGDEQTVEQVTVITRDNHLQVEVAAHYALFTHHGVLARWVTVRNDSSTPYVLTAAGSSACDFDQQGFEVVHLPGMWAQERQIERQALPTGTLTIASNRGISSHQANPYVALLAADTTLNHGLAYSFNLVYSGNFSQQMMTTPQGRVRVVTGINPDSFAWSLAPGASFTTPEAILTVTTAGVNGLMATQHSFLEQHLIAPRWQKDLRPIVLNNWEATYFDFDEERLVTLAQQAQKLGIEAFMLDDGCFGHRNDDTTSLSDWHVNRHKFPQGLAHFTKRLHDKGLKVGLWIEPEMISPGTRWWQTHPDWCLRPPYGRSSVGRHQYVLDMGNPDVVEALFHQLAPLLAETQCDLVKWDMNRVLTEPYSVYLHEHHELPGEVYHRYVLGVYALYHRLLTRFPKLLIEGCAGGGGRYDLGILYYSPQIWPSDNTDAVDRLSILSGTLLGYPVSTFSNHVSACPNGQVGRTTSLALRQLVADIGPLGYELDVTQLSATEQNAIRTNISWYKQHRELLTHGQFWQLLSLDPQANEVAFALSSPDKRQLLVAYVRKLARANPAPLRYLPLPCVNTQANYRLADGTLLNGQLLKTIGIKVPEQMTAPIWQVPEELRGDYQGCWYELTEELTGTDEL